jgi:hypothetical protein
MTLSRLPEGIVTPYAELPVHQQNELIGWLRAENERKEREDPILHLKLLYPDLSAFDGQVHSMRRSTATKMNNALAFGFLRAQKAREQRWLDWEEAVRSEAKAASAAYKALKASAEEAATMVIPSSSQELASYRRTHVARVRAVEPRVIPKPSQDWTPEEALWYPVDSDGVGVIKHD